MRTCAPRNEAVTKALRHLASHVTEAQVEAMAKAVCLSGEFECIHRENDIGIRAGMCGSCDGIARAALTAYWTYVLGETK